jgi:hypothetical protein
MKDKLIQLLDIDSSDTEALTKLELLIDICTEEAVAFTNQTDTDELQNLILLMVSERWNKIGYEGFSSYSYSGVSESLLEDYSLTVQRMIASKRKLKSV